MAVAEECSGARRQRRAKRIQNKQTNVSQPICPMRRGGSHHWTTSKTTVAIVALRSKRQIYSPLSSIAYEEFRSIMKIG